MKKTTTPPLLPTFCLLHRCQCKGDTPPGVSSLSSATRRNKRGGGLENKDNNNTSNAATIPSAAPLSVQGGRASGHVFPRLSHTRRQGGEWLEKEDNDNTSDAAIPSVAPLSVCLRACLPLAQNKQTHDPHTQLTIFYHDVLRK